MKDESRLIFVSRHETKVKEYKISRVKIISYLSIFLISFTFLGKVGLDLLVDFSHNSRITKLERTNTVLQSRLQDAKVKIKVIGNQIAEITQKDDSLRTVMGVPILSADVREVGIGGSNYNYDFQDEVHGFEDNIGLGEQFAHLNKLEREVKLEMDSYTNLLSTFNKKQDSLRYMPSLKPVLSGIISSSFGSRLHPIYKVRRHHDGLDLSAKYGSSVYASADGVVIFTGLAGGYGKLIKINHKYGFETRYGHLSKILVRHGEQVKRGQKIAEVGSTGLSTAPHLHYEVRLHNNPINPRAYYFDDNILNEKIVKK